MPGRQPALPWPPRSSGAGQAGAFSRDLLKYSAPFPLRSRAGSGRLLLVSACRGLSRPWGVGLAGPCSGLGATGGGGVGAALRPGTLVTAASVGQWCSSPRGQASGGPSQGRSRCRGCHPGACTPRCHQLPPGITVGPPAPHRHQPHKSQWRESPGEGAPGAAGAGGAGGGTAVGLGRAWGGGLQRGRRAGGWAVMD